MNIEKICVVASSGDGGLKLSQITRSLYCNFIVPFPFAELNDEDLLDVFTLMPDGSEFSFSKTSSLPSIISLALVAQSPEPAPAPLEPIAYSDLSAPPEPSAYSNLSVTNSTASSAPSSPPSSPATLAPFISYTRMLTAEAIITPVHKAAPTFSEGKITPANVNTWEHHCIQYFHDHNVPARDQTFKASMGFSNLLLHEWYNSHCNHFDGMPFDKFADEVCGHFLPPNWAGKICDDISECKMKPSDVFEDYVLDMECLNAQLRGAAHHFSDDAMRMFICGSVCPNLKAMINDDATDGIQDYVAWKAAVTAKDCERIHQIKMVKDLLVINNNLAGHRAKAGANTADKLPGLTANERLILENNNGCFKCRKINVYDKNKHHSANCPNGAPNPTTYVPLTTVYPNLIPAAAGKENARPRNRNTTTVSNGGPEEEDDPVITVTSVGTSLSPPVYTTGILNKGSDSKSSYVPPFFADQTFLCARTSPYLDSPLYNMLIDGGAGPVLIRRDVALAMNVRLRRLPSTHKLGDTWGDNGSSGVRCREWVKLAVSLPDLSWSSCVCCALVVDNLCAPVILGKAWLESNAIIEDHAVHTLVHKLTGRDLLSPALLPLLPLLSSLPRAHHQAKCEAEIAEHDNDWIRHWGFLRELKERTVDHRIAADACMVDASAFAANAVHVRVEMLVSLQTLAWENVAMKAKFADWFPDDIPHISHLPTDVYHCFVLKDANMVISCCQYDCPKKYRDIWKSLLDEHLTAGQLRPSDSPYASPAFLVPMMCTVREIY